ncbi:MAG: ribosome maturation factor [Desulfuromonadales bacterium]|nr:ribosome maturation factor [Desulfuromonadales bacterium]NIR33773.1 ribosome maturation factor [Desulfuromonadales bacterium]NIS42457.1 ribosome maturation factor [Desulfuromonadales bacterium]
MATGTIRQKVEGLIEPVLSDLGYELVDLEYRREGRDMVLRFYIDREGGVTLDDCVDVSREVGSLLEVEDVIPGSFRLEVSSPGLDRPLKKKADFERFAGNLARIKMLDRIDPDGRGHERKTFVGRLQGLREGSVVLELSDKKGGTALLPLDGIERANLEIEI